jgi:hypothetical protein
MIFIDRHTGAELLDEQNTDIASEQDHNKGHRSESDSDSCSSRCVGIRIRIYNVESPTHLDFWIP